MRAQVSVFIIIGVLLMVSAGLVFWVTSPKSSVKLKYSDGAAPVKAYVEQCIASTAAQGIEYASNQAGHIYSIQKGQSPEPSSYYPQNNYKVPYLVEDRGTGMGYFGFNDIDRDLELELMQFFVNRFTDSGSPTLCNVEQEMRQLGYDVAVDRAGIASTAVLNDKELLVSLHAPITVKLQGTEYFLEDFSWSQNTVVQPSYFAAKEVITEIQAGAPAGRKQKHAGQRSIGLKPKVQASHGAGTDSYLVALEDELVNSPSIEDFKFGSKAQVIAGS